jgi:hypothetical protein
VGQIYLVDNPLLHMPNESARGRLADVVEIGVADEHYVADGRVIR